MVVCTFDVVLCVVLICAATFLSNSEKGLFLWFMPLNSSTDVGAVYATTVLG